MADYLNVLAARSLDLLQEIQPRLPGRYETIPPPGEGEPGIGWQGIGWLDEMQSDWKEEVLEVAAPPPDAAELATEAPRLAKRPTVNTAIYAKMEEPASSHRESDATEPAEAEPPQFLPNQRSWEADRPARATSPQVGKAQRAQLQLAEPQSITIAVPPQPFELPHREVGRVRPVPAANGSEERAWGEVEEHIERPKPTPRLAEIEPVRIEPPPRLQPAPQVPTPVAHPASVTSQPRLAPPIEPVVRARPVSRLPRREEPVRETGPAIQVTIGRIEIRATPLVGKVPPKKPSRELVSNLEEYLRQRNGGDR